MPRLETRDIVAISLAASTWAILNVTITPIFWQATRLPILCDMVGASLLILTIWWTRRPLCASAMGLIATILNFMLRPIALHFLGFTAASFIFDISSRAIGYRTLLDRRLIGSALLVLVSVISTLIAGLIIGSFFMAPTQVFSAYGGITFFAALHGAGGLIGGIIGVIILNGLKARGVKIQKIELQDKSSITI